MLKTLCLESVDFDGDVNNLLSNCHVHEEFYLEELDYKDQQHVQWSGSLSSPSLKRVCLRFVDLPDISFYFPNLVYFELVGEVRSKYPNVKLDSLVEARLDLLVEPTVILGARHGDVRLIPINKIRNFQTLHLSSDVLELFYFSCQELPVFDSLVCLSIESDKKRGWQILQLPIKNSPNLETLKFKSLKHYMKNKCGDVCV